MNRHQGHQPAPAMMSNMNYQNGNPAQSQPQLPQPQVSMPGVTIFNETPNTNSTFPISYRPKLIVAVSFFKIFIGISQLGIGIVDIFALPDYWTFWAPYIAFPIGCGVLFIGNGVIGCLTFKRPSKCLIGSFLCLSIASLVLSPSMLVFCSIVLSYPDDYFNWDDYHSHDAITGITIFLIVLICFELSLSIAAVVYSCKAYSKCCNTCKVKDCCTCVGCCECDRQTVPYTVQSNYPIGSENAANAHQQRQPEIAATSQQNQYSFPYPSVVIISFPGVSHAINAASVSTSATQEPYTFQVTMQGNNSNQQANVPSREGVSISQAGGATAHAYSQQEDLLGFREQQQAPPSYSRE